MIWLGNLKSLRSALHKPRFGVPLEVHTWLRSETDLTFPNPLAVENLDAEHGRGIHLMKLALDEVSFERGGTEVQI